VEGIATHAVDILAGGPARDLARPGMIVTFGQCDPTSSRPHAKALSACWRRHRRVPAVYTLTARAHDRHRADAALLQASDTIACRLADGAVVSESIRQVAIEEGICAPDKIVGARAAAPKGGTRRAVQSDIVPPEARRSFVPLRRREDDLSLACRTIVRERGSSRWRRHGAVRDRSPMHG